MSIEERILNDNRCSPYVDKGRGYVEIAFKDGAHWGYEQGCKDMIDKVSEWLSTHSEDVTCKSVGLYGCKAVMSEDLINNLRKAMEE